MFQAQKGIKLPEYFSQQRIEDGKIKGKRLFSFSPNRLITPAVFKILTTEQIRKVILFGEAGIGKTCAIVLYAYLSKIVTDDLLKNESRKKEVLEFIEK